MGLLNQIGGKHFLVETEDKPMEEEHVAGNEGDKGADYRSGVWSPGYCVGKYDEGFKEFKTQMSRDKCLQVCTDHNARGCQFDQNTKDERGSCFMYTVKVHASKGGSNNFFLRQPVDLEANGWA